LFHPQISRQTISCTKLSNSSPNFAAFIHQLPSKQTLVQRYRTRLQIITVVPVP
jgi:hypothetical protein